MSSLSSGDSASGTDGVFSLSISTFVPRSFPNSTQPMRREGEGEDFWPPFFSTMCLPSDFFCATGVARPADGNHFSAAAGLILVASLSGCRAGARVETTKIPDGTRCRDVEAPSGLDPVAPDVVPFLAVIPTVCVLIVERCRSTRGFAGSC